MVMFSELLRFAVRDGRGAEARLRDVAVDLSSGDYPPVTHLLIRGHGFRRMLKWDAVERVDGDNNCIEVGEFGESDDALPNEVLLDRDVLDALIIDVPRRHTMRANDLWLDVESGHLALRAADIGAWAVVRRLARGLFGGASHGHLLDWHDIEYLRGDPAAARAGGDYHRRVTNLQSAEIARLLDALPYLHAAELLELLDEDLAADTLEVMRAARQVQVFEEFESDRRVRLLQLMAPDNAADLLGWLGPKTARAHLEALDAETRARLVDLLRYPDNTAGGIMTNDIVVVEAGSSVGQAHQRLRDVIGTPDFVYYVFAVDDLEACHLRGVFTLRDLLVADEDARVEDVMRQAVEVLDPLMSAEAAARRVVEQHLAALPVVSRDGRVLGIITVDAALLVLAPDALSDAVPRVFS
jgi:magnesium transporter